MRLNTIIVIVIGFTFFHCSQPVVVPEKHSGIYLTGRVLDKDGKPVPNVAARLAAKGAGDITDANGVYIIIDSIGGQAVAKQMAGGVVDSVVFERDGQRITSVEVTRWIDTLPDVFIVQRDIYGSFSSSGQVGSIGAIISGDGGASSKNVDLWYNAANNSYSGFVYFVYSGSVGYYSVRIDVFTADSGLIGRSVTIDFPSTAGNINIPAFDPSNALPVVRAIADPTVSIGDTVRLTGSADLFSGAQIVLWEWSIGGGPFIATSSPDTALVAPPQPVDRYTCILRGTDTNGNSATDETVITVLADVPRAFAGSDTALLIGDTLRLSGNASQLFGTIAGWEWDIGNTGNFSPTTTGDTTVVMSATGDSVVLCILRVTDDDGNVAADTLSVHLCGTGEKWIRVQPEYALPSGAQLQPFAGRLLLFDREATDGKNDIWSSDDGFSWTKITDSAEFSPQRNFATVSFDNKLWVLRGDRDTIEWNTAIWNSADGAAWTKAGTYEGFLGPAEPSKAESFGDQLWVFAPVSGGGGVWKSADGISWAKVDYTPGFSMSDFCTATIFQGDLWLFGPKGMAWRSSDGANYELNEIAAADAPPGAPSPFEKYIGLAFGDRLIVLCGKGLFQSYDGETWTYRGYYGLYPSIDSRTVSSAVFNGKLWLAADSGLWYSK